jgi:hypothetical protein
MPRIFSSLSQRKLLSILLLFAFSSMLIMPGIAVVNAAVLTWEEGHISGFDAQCEFLGFNNNVLHDKNTQLVKIETIAVHNTNEENVKLFEGLGLFKVSLVVWTAISPSEAVSRTETARSAKWLVLNTNPHPGDATSPWVTTNKFVSWNEYTNVAPTPRAAGIDTSLSGNIKLNFTITQPGQNVDLDQIGVTITHKQFVYEISKAYVTKTETVEVGRYEDIIVEGGTSAMLDYVGMDTSGINYGDNTPAKDWIGQMIPYSGFIRGQDTTPWLQDGIVTFSDVGSEVHTAGINLKLRPHIYKYCQGYSVSRINVDCDPQRDRVDGSKPLFFAPSGPSMTESGTRIRAWHINNVAVRMEMEVAVKLWSTCEIQGIDGNPPDLEMPDPILSDLYWDDMVNHQQETITEAGSPWQHAWANWWEQNKIWVSLAIVAVVAMIGLYAYYVTPVGAGIRTIRGNQPQKVR